jgi:menaquinone-dependent protoporphyrinogen oxidase
MTASVLVAYAPRYGFTQEVAEAVAAALREDGIEVDVQPARAVKAVGDYRALVLGAPLQTSGLHKDALAFFERHRPVLARQTVAVFALGPFDDESEEWQEVRTRLDQELAKFPWFAPVSVEVFSANTLGLRWKLIPALKNMPASDIGDLAAVRSWAHTLPQKLALVAE